MIQKTIGDKIYKNFRTYGKQGKQIGKSTKSKQKRWAIGHIMTE
ncbi:hypothetical protein [Prevotella falsenii]|nr:hypothetical protein [Prevotella falsenii]